MSAQAGLLRDKTVLVTGASRGIGRCIAETYASQGAKLIITAEPSQESELQQVAKACSQHGKDNVVNASILLCDLTDSSQISQLCQKTFEMHSSGVDVLVNNAGMLGPTDFDMENMGQGPLEGDPDEWNKIYQANVLAPMRLTRALCPAMREAGQGWVINICSAAGLVPSPTNGAYCSSKWGLRGWSLTCHEALKEHGIRVVTIHPGAVRTEMTMNRPDMDPIPKMEIQPEDIAEAALLPFRCSQNALPVEIMMQTVRKSNKS
ncbi:hypothetical protein WJX73_002633 [Symbiochloris irregularis]|uniref:Uncharacterized protein n=1 Tax=Symbiochloris irregularis TaxID=706552 RepID=A0AAW1P9N4_9CHLO